MKQHFLFFTAAMILLIGSCSSSASKPKEEGSQDPEVAENTTVEKKGGEKASHSAELLNTDEFKTRVFDYEKNPTQWVFEGKRPCLVDFYADWCAPCRITSPILEELAVEYKDKIDVYKINVDKDQELAAIFGIQGIPSFLFCPMEGRPTMTSGIAQTPEETKQMFRQQIDRILLGKEMRP